MEGTNFRIASVNTNGIDKQKIDKIYDFMNHEIILIQETHNGFNKEINHIRREN